MASVAASRAGSVPRDNLPDDPPDTQLSREQRVEEATTYLVRKKHITRGDTLTNKLLTSVIHGLLQNKTVSQVQRDTIGYALTLLDEVGRRNEMEREELERKITEGEEKMAEMEGEEDEEGEIVDEPATKESVNDLKTMVLNMAEQLKDMKELIIGGVPPPSTPALNDTQTTPTTQATSMPLASRHGSRPLYSFAARNAATTSTTQTQAMEEKLARERAQARREIMSRQVLVTIPDEDVFRKIVANSEQEAILRSRSIIKSILPDEEIEDFAIRAVKFMKGHDILFEVKTVRAAAKLREKEIAQKYAEAWAPEATVVPRLTTVIANFVPITLDVKGTNTVAHIESMNGLKPGTIHSISWCRTTPFPEEQRVALLKIQLSVRAAAIYLVTRGMTIEHKRVKIRMDDKDPLQCHNCYFWAHTARRCKGNETCGRCGRGHRTSTCTETDKYCVSCKSNDHCSIDRTCPFYAKQKEFMRLCDPDAGAALCSITEEEAAIEFRNDLDMVWNGATWTHSETAFSAEPPVGPWV